MRHRFDVLGSGWVHVRHGMSCAGVEGVRFAAPEPAADWLASEVSGPNLGIARRVWGLVDRDYVPIDWQRDFKSGYRWSAREWAGHIRYGNVRGADVKVPWELARLQHLGQLAVAHAAVCDGALPGGAERALRYAREFRNEVLDFVASNPPRYGVNWTSAMDVAIRIANVLFAYDLFRRHGATFDAAFETVLRGTAADHARFVLQFLEWNDELRGNHYLANLAGLLFAAAYLPSTRETDGWLAFALRELVDEIALQFNAEGSNFEGSTAYHRLSAEMVVYATALIATLPSERVARIARGEYQPPRIVGPDVSTPPAVRVLDDGRASVVPGWLPGLLERMATFSLACEKVPNEIVLFGDNDSGRFIKLHARYIRRTVAEAQARYANLEGVDLAVDTDYWDEDHQTPAQLVAAIAGLTGRADDESDTTLERALFGAWGSTVVRAARAADAPMPQPIDRTPRTVDVANAAASFPHARVREFVADVPAVQSLRDGLVEMSFPAFGLYVARSSRVYLAVRCGPVGQNGHGGHDHNDQLACEIVIDGVPRITDAGTYLYSPFPEIRNAYRASRAHFVPWPRDEEPSRLTDSLFSLGGAQPGRCIVWGNGRFVGEHHARGAGTRREIVIESDRVVITDRATERLPDSPTGPVRFAPAYGVVRHGTA